MLRKLRKLRKLSTNFALVWSSSHGVMRTRLQVCLILLGLCPLLNAKYSIYDLPEVKWEIFKGKGIRVIVSDVKGMESLRVHVSVDGDQSRPKTADQYDFWVSLVVKNANLWFHTMEHYVYKPGDWFGYALFIQYENECVYKNNLRWNITELVDYYDFSSSNDGSCDYFHSLNENKWKVHKFIPSLGPDYEFNYYTPDAVKLVDAGIAITPTPKDSELDVRGTLDLTNGCTSLKSEECYYEQHGAYYLPPVQSGMLTSLTRHKYGEYKVVAQFPCGDWLVPELSLVSTTNPMQKIVMGYARGNEELVDGSGAHLGGHVVFAGIRSNATQRLVKLIYEDEVFCKREHEYTITYNRDSVAFMVDEHQVSTLNLDSTTFPESEFIMQIGVRVGGISDFPDNSTSGEYRKPWRNRDRLQVKKFFNAREKWMPTWQDSSMIVHFACLP